MQTHNLADFLARSTTKPFEETTLSTVLAGLPPLSPHGPWLGGGALRRTFMGEEPDSDFDFFFKDADSLLGFASALEQRGFHKVRETQHHIQYRGAVAGSGIERDIQLIRFRWYDTAEEVADSFDFTICQAVFDGQTLVVGDFTLWDLGRKRLAVHKVTFPVSSMRRVLKYTRQGFYACAGCLTALLNATRDNPELQTDIEYID